MRQQYMRKGDGFLIMFSITDRTSFQTVRQLYKDILRTKDKDNFPVLMVGNKIDLADERKVSETEAKELAVELNVSPRIKLL